MVKVRRSRLKMNLGTAGVLPHEGGTPASFRGQLAILFGETPWRGFPEIGFLRVISEIPELYMAPKLPPKRLNSMVLS